MPADGRLGTARDALADAYAGFTRLVTALTEEDLGRPTHCTAWTVAELTYHLLLDAQRALVALATPDPGPATRDFVSYWHAYDNSDPALAARAAAFVRTSAGAHGSPLVIVERWAETANAAVHAARQASGLVTTQGVVLPVADFLDTLTTEAVVHHLDATADLPAAPAPAPRALMAVFHTLHGLAGADLPASWSGSEAVLKATGRLSLTAADRADLGALVDRLPLLA